MTSTGAIFRLLLVLAVFAQHYAVAAADPADANALLKGKFDNREQVAEAKPDAEPPMPHVVVTIEPTPQKNWTLWRVHLEVDADNVFDQAWAMETRREHDGSTSLVPYYQYKPTAPASAATFDPKTWLSLEACALRGKFTKTRIEGMSEGEPCVAVSMGIGPLRALLPVGIEREGDWLHLDLNYRGARTRIDARAAP